MWVNLYTWIEIFVRIFTARLVYPRCRSILWIICVGRYAREILSLQVPSNQDILNVAARVLDLAEQVLQEERDGANGYL